MGFKKSFCEERQKIKKNMQAAKRTSHQLRKKKEPVGKESPLTSKEESSRCVLLDGIKAELFKLVQSVCGIDRASQIKKNGVKDNFLDLHALTKNHVLCYHFALSCVVILQRTMCSTHKLCWSFCRGLLLVSRPSIFTVLTSTRCISLILTLTSWTLRISLLSYLGCDTWCK